MQNLSKRQAVLVGVVLILVLLGLFFFFQRKTEVIPEVSVVIEKEKVTAKYKVVGTSVEGRKIEAFTFGEGETNILFVGGIHGGYEWNSVVLAYKMMDFFEATPSAVPLNLKITIIPALNPDGAYKIVGKEGRFVASDIPAGKAEEPGRFNANMVDLNRNFDCKWKSESVWREKIVSAGSKPFSEPEAQAFRDFVLSTKPASVVFWHSQAGAVYASECENGILPETIAIMNTYAKASGYKAFQTFDSYQTTGDADAWLASIGIPAVSVEFTNHKSIEWEKNLAGVKALLEYYRK